MKKKKIKKVNSHKEKILHIFTILGLFLVVSTSFYLILNADKFSFTGYAIYESASDGSTINDTYLRENNPNNNFGTAITLRVGNITTGGGTEYRSLIKDFNISSINSSDSISSAFLQLYVNESFGNTNITVRIYRITADWNETEATWNNRSTIIAWSTAGGDFLEQIDALNITNVSGSLYNFTVTNAVSGWLNGSYINYGLLLAAPNTADGNFTYFASSEDSTASFRPKFTIDHSANAAPEISNITTNSTLTNPIPSGQQVNITVNWTDLESNTGQLFICNSTSVNSTGCGDTTLCNTSFETTGPSSCEYTILSTDNRTTTFYASVCDSVGNCSSANSSEFFMNHIPTILVVDPDGGETVNQTQGNYTIKFNVSDADSDALTANIYYGSTQNSTTNVIVSDLSLTASTCTDSDTDNSTANNCTYSWNSSGIFTTAFLTIIVNDTFTTANDSSNENFDIRSLSDSTPPNITAQRIDANITSGESITIYANVSDSSIQAVWVAINTTPQVNITMTNTSLVEYSTNWTAVAVGNYQFQVYANDTTGNTNNTATPQNFTVGRPNATSQNETAPSTALPYNTIRITSQLNATDVLRDVYANLTTHPEFTFLENYSQNTLLGNFSENETKTVTWFVSTPITEATYSLNVTYTDNYVNVYNSSDLRVQVTSAIGGYEISIETYPEVETSGSYFTRGFFKQNGVYTTADTMTVLIYDATGSLTVGPSLMSNESTGIYNFSYTVGASAAEGQWETVVNATKDSIYYISREFWKVVGGPFDVRNIVIVDAEVPTLNISVITENTGGANKDLTLAWNLSRVDTSAILDSGADTFAVTANSERTWYIQPSTTFVGSVKITFLGTFSGTEKAGAFKTFTTTSGADDGGGGGGRGGGGGGGAAITPPTKVTKNYDLFLDFEKIIYIPRNLEKITSLIITNIGQEELTDISLEIENLDTKLYKISPTLIPILPQGDSEEFKITFFVSNLIGEQNIKYVVKSNEITKEESGKLIVLTIPEYLLKEIERLRQKIKELREDLTDDELLEDLKTCEDIINKVEQDTQKEEFINANDDLKKAEDCINEVENNIKKKERGFKLVNIGWIVIAGLLILLIIVLIVIVYILYNKFGIINFLKQKKDLPIKREIDTNVKKQYIDEKIKNIEEKLKD